MKRLTQPHSREDMLRDFPIEMPSAPGWYFRRKEVGNMFWEVEGRDIYGRTVGGTKGGDIDTIMADYAADAMAITRQI